MVLTNIKKWLNLKTIIGSFIVFMVVFNNVLFKALAFLTTERIAIALLFLLVGFVLEKEIAFNK